jgi:hypothetical protein
MASADLSRRVEKVVGYPPLSEMGALDAALSARVEALPPRRGIRSTRTSQRSWRPESAVRTEAGLALVFPVALSDRPTDSYGGGQSIAAKASGGTVPR